MQIRGHIHDGLVVLDRDPGLPNGTEVSVSLPMGMDAKIRQRVTFPLIPGKSPSSVDLTNERIAEIMDDDDASS